MPLSVPCQIVSEADQIEGRLREHFGTTRGDLIQIVLMAVAARRDSTEDDPATAPGTLSYIYGTRALRSVFRAMKWQKHRKDGIEAVVSPDARLQIIFQNVDLAAEQAHTPKAISGKKSASQRLIETGQGDLFVSPNVTAIKLPGEHREIWYLCVSCDDLTGIRAELSRPLPVEDEQFVGFHERIFIVIKGQLEAPIVDLDDGMPEQHFEINISRK
ncbi:MAG: hypothetical protein ABF876_03110 [Acetobacter aceti]|uniref:hypothetical protein n=1 Tax=Gluconobacter sp. TaxID=1876758 RepID=UPI0039E8EBAC